MSEDVIRIVVPGPPRGWERPADSPSGGKHRFTPKKMRAEQTAIGYIATAAMVGRVPFNGPIDLRVGAFFPVPKSWSKAKRAAALAGTIRHTSKPDASNVVKLLEDALNRVVWADDAQVCDLTIRKRYSETPRLVVEVRPLQEASAHEGREAKPSSIFG